MSDDRSLARRLAPVFGWLLFAFAGTVPLAVGSCALDARCSDFRDISDFWAIMLLATGIIESVVGIIFLGMSFWKACLQ